MNLFSFFKNISLETYVLCESNVKRKIEKKKIEIFQYLNICLRIGNALGNRCNNLSNHKVSDSLLVNSFKFKHCFQEAKISIITIFNLN